MIKGIRIQLGKECFSGPVEETLRIEFKADGLFEPQHGELLDRCLDGGHLNAEEVKGLEEWAESTLFWIEKNRKKIEAQDKKIRAKVKVEKARSAEIDKKAKETFAHTTAVRKNIAKERRRGAALETVKKPGKKSAKKGKK